jgi:hypothetical protein
MSGRRRSKLQFCSLSGSGHLFLYFSVPRRHRFLSIAVDILKAYSTVALCMPQEVCDCTQERHASFLGSVKTLPDSLFRTMLPADMPVPTVTARKLIFLFARRCFPITRAKGQQYSSVSAAQVKSSLSITASSTFRPLHGSAKSSDWRE